MGERRESRRTALGARRLRRVHFWLATPLVAVALGLAACGGGPSTSPTLFPPPGEGGVLPESCGDAAGLARVDPITDRISCGVGVCLDLVGADCAQRPLDEAQAFLDDLRSRVIDLGDPAQVDDVAMRLSRIWGDDALRLLESELPDIARTFGADIVRASVVDDMLRALLRVARR